ncbi:hypothetical protein [Methanobrevibacter curvatus]|uniref:Uncharacterized protein n=1 Tax=Methanobrevibacter curvatus TaxID=49547 RepID=A0A165ZKA9_9EURY|nr:hypothetical protein [Methanobrevibacter curvatus]KZX10829.1 hypothetical protein MBCUR_16270 [Methanobrevibacter curvatus]
MGYYFADWKYDNDFKDDEGREAVVALCNKVINLIEKFRDNPDNDDMDDLIWYGFSDLMSQI